ncbi:hypothetical protein BGZ91_003833, partial [Linnemannia elongata]
MGWNHRAAGNGDKFAQDNIGSLYERGEGVLKGKTVGMDWYEMLAEKGHIRAKGSVRIH